jgi:hypothetical protein
MIGENQPVILKVVGEGGTATCRDAESGSGSNQGYPRNRSCTKPASVNLRSVCFPNRASLAWHQGENIQAVVSCTFQRAFSDVSSNEITG